jgi:hypothetical protein
LITNLNNKEMEACKYLCVTLPTFYIAALLQLNQTVQAHQMVRAYTTILERFTRQ